MITLTTKHWQKVEIAGPESCWIWTGSTDDKGYGQIRKDKRLYRLSRVMLAWADGIEIPDQKIFVLHSCDNSSCINPLHLRWGSHTENVEDASNRKRWRKDGLKGEQHNQAKLTEADVKEIRRLHEYGADQLILAQNFQVTRRTINMIVNKKTWRHI